MYRTESSSKKGRAADRKYRTIKQIMDNTTTAATAAVTEEMLSGNNMDDGGYSLLKQTLPMMIIYTLAYSAVFILGVVGNSLIVWIVFSNAHMHTVTNYFIVNLAVADILVCVFCLPITLLSNLLSGWSYGAFMCKATPFLQGVAVNASVNTLMAVAFDRYLAICHGMRCHLTRKMARVIIALIWTFAAVVMSPWAVYYQQVDLSEDFDFGPPAPSHAASVDVPPSPETEILGWFTEVPSFADADVAITASGVAVPPPSDSSVVDGASQYYICKQCWTSRDLEATYFLAAIFLTCYTIPLICISACYVFIGRRVCNRQAVGMNDNGQQSVIQRSKVKVIKMLVTVVVVFAFSWLPLYVVQLRLYYGPELIPYTAEFTWLVTVVIPVAQWMGSANSCVNPFIYCFFSKKFRAGFRHLLVTRRCCCCCCCCCHLEPPDDVWKRAASSRGSFAAGGSTIYRTNCVLGAGAVRQVAVDCSSSGGTLMTSVDCRTSSDVQTSCAGLEYRANVAGTNMLFEATAL